MFVAPRTCALGGNLRFRQPRWWEDRGVSQVLVLSGAGAYADPWHPFAETSALIAQVLTEAGHDVEVSEQVEARLADLDGVDVLVVNAGDPGRDGQPASELVPAARAGLRAYRRRGGGIVAVHAAASTLPHVDEWAEAIGGRWVRGTSMHPEIGDAQIQVRDAAHPVTSGLDDFVTFDERYSYLELGAHATVLASHSHDGIDHPMVWATESGNAHSVYIGLGHDARAYDAPETRRLLAQAVGWVADR